MSRPVSHSRRFAAAGVVMLVAALGSALPAHAEDVTAAGHKCWIGCTPATTAPPVTIPVTFDPEPIVELPLPITTPTTIAAPAALPSAAQRLLELANADRVNAGLRALTMRADVSAFALAHSWDMAGKATIFHNDALFTPAVKKQFAAKGAGENVAFNTNLDDTHVRLMNSPGHRANLMDPDFTVVGIGVVKAGNVFYTTQDFIQPSGAAPAAAPAPAAATKPKSAPAPAAPRPPAKPVVAKVTATTAAGGAGPATDPSEAAASPSPEGSVAGSSVGDAGTFELASAPAPAMVAPAASTSVAIQLLVALLMLLVAAASGARAIRAAKR